MRPYQIEKVCAVTGYWLLALLPISVLGLVACAEISWAWDAMMAASRFAYWPYVPGISWIMASYGAILLLALASLVVVLRGIVFSFKWFALLALGAALLSWVGLFAFLFGACPDSSTAAALMPQVDAVTNYNRGYCVAWCQWLAKNSKLAKTGLCDVEETTAFDLVVYDATPGVQMWCTEAILTKSFAQTASHKGFSPFVGIKFDCPLGVRGWRFANGLAIVVIFAASIFLLVPAWTIVDDRFRATTQEQRRLLTSGS